jgi:polyisoprenoid-binding protein YceI
MQSFVLLYQKFIKGKEMKTIAVILFAVLLSTSVFAQRWILDKSHSNVRFTVSHLVISEVEGSFRNFEGTIKSSKPDFSDAVIEFDVAINSIDTDNEKRDGHLKSDDFFNAEKYPKMTFKSTSFEKKGENKYLLKGNLTIRDVTKPVTFDVTYGGSAKDGYGNNKAGFKAKTTINRFDYGLKWNAITEAGGAVVGKDVDIDLKLQFAQGNES